MDHQYESEYSPVFDRNENRRISVCKKALVGEVCLSFWLAVLPAFDLAGNDLLLAAVYGGVIQESESALYFWEEEPQAVPI